MKKFKFSLEKVLEIKEIEEKIIQKNLYLVQHQIYETEQKILTLEENISDERVKVSSLQSGPSSSMDIMLHYNYIDSMTAQIDIHNLELNDLRFKEMTIKKELIEKSKEKKALERLREIKYEEFRKEYNKAQQLFIDEISIQNHRLKKVKHEI
jgi:flagellar FliJ protein